MGWACRRFGHLPFFLPLRIDAPLSRESRWRDGKEASRQASVVEKGSSSARPGLDFPPFSPIFPFQLSHSASPSSHHSPSRAVSAVPVTEEFSVQILLRTSNPKKSPFFRSSSAMRTASMASGVMDGPKIAMLGSACPGGFKFIKLVTSGSGTDSEAEFVNSMWGGRRKRPGEL